MILYFDTFITDIPLPRRGRHLLKEDIRKYCSAYAMPTRLDIAKYVLASYSLYPWSHVLIKYQLENSSQNAELDAYILDLFPKAIIIHNRSDTQKKYKESLKVLEKMNDPWIFYSPNNDHPIISNDTNIIDYMNSLIKKANIWRKEYQYVSIMYSHFSEFLNIPVKGNPEHFLNGNQTTILEDDQLARVYLKPKGDFSSVQITNIDLMKKWFTFSTLGNKRVIRAEDTIHNVTIGNQIIIAPKQEICAHFDGYEHMLGYFNEIQIDKVPPLFIPKGFFEKNIKIAYGYDIYREGWVNINPQAKRYSFRDNKKGTDLKISLNEIPLFWKKYIKQIDKNSKNIHNLEVYAKKNKAIKENPWSIKNQGITIRSIKFWIKYSFFRLIIKVRMTASSLGIKKLFINHNA